MKRVVYIGGAFLLSAIGIAFFFLMSGLWLGTELFGVPASWMRPVVVAELSTIAFGAAMASLFVAREMGTLTSLHQGEHTRIGAFLSATYRLPAFLSLAIVAAAICVGLGATVMRFGVHANVSMAWLCLAVTLAIAGRLIALSWRAILFRRFGEAAPAKIGRWFPVSLRSRVRRSLVFPALGVTFLLGAQGWYLRDYASLVIAVLVAVVVVSVGDRLGQAVADDVLASLRALRLVSSGDALRAEENSTDLFIRKPTFMRMSHRFLQGVKTLAKSYRDAAAQETDARRALEQGEALKTLFVAYMSHDLRSPLNAVVGFSDVLLAGHDGVLKEEQRESVQEIRDGGKELLRLVTDIVDTARVDAGRLKLTPEYLAADILIEEAVEDALGLTGTSLRFLPERPTALAPVYTDRDRMAQALTAIFVFIGKLTDFVPVRIRAREYSTRIELLIDVEGGLPLLDAAGLFDGMRSHRRPSGRRMQGLGLGLSLARQLVQAHGGAIEYVRASEGGYFRVELPIGHRAAMLQSAWESA